MFIRMNLIVFTLFLLGLALPVKAQGNCAKRDTVAEQLGKRYSEAQTGAGLQSRDRIVEVWASDDGTWTILVTNARGVSCILASGTHWRASEPPVELSGTPS